MNSRTPISENPDRPKMNPERSFLKPQTSKNQTSYKLNPKLLSLNVHNTECISGLDRSAPFWMQDARLPEKVNWPARVGGWWLAGRLGGGGGWVGVWLRCQAEACSLHCGGSSGGGFVATLHNWRPKVCREICTILKMQVKTPGLMIGLNGNNLFHIIHNI